MELQPGTHITDKLRLVRRLRQGAMGELWVAEHTTLKTEVAVKLILDEATERFGDLEQRFALEAEATAKVHSPHVVRIFDCGQTRDGAAYIVMELLEGESLQEHIERSGPFGPTEVGEILRQAGRALDAAHAVGIVHRDVKPQNIFLSYMHGEPHIKMVDFGSAKHLGPRKERPQTAPDLVVGTPAYVSPDQLANPGKVDFRTDLWALGVTVYKCLTGELPFRGDDMVETCNAILEGKLYAPSRARPSLGKLYDAWFVRVFHPDRSLRPQSGGEMAQSFAALERKSVAANSVKRHMLASVAATGIATALATVVLLATLGGRRGPGPMQEARATLDPTVATGAPGSGASAGAGAPSATAPPGPTVAPAGVHTGAPPTAPAAASAAPATSATASATAATSATASATATTAMAAPERPGGSAAESATSGGGVDAWLAQLAARRVAVPDGKFWFGCKEAVDADCAADEKPGHVASVTALRMDRSEVRTGDFAACVRAGACSAEGLGSEHGGGRSAAPNERCNWQHGERVGHPVNCVDFAQAEAFCRWAGGRLPHENEWEKAARGLDGRKFPWGGPSASCNFTVMTQGAEGCGAGGTMEAESKPGGASPYGALGMAGNVAEWVDGWYDEPGHSRRVVRGGHWGDSEGRLLRTSARRGLAPSERSVHVGFRCVAD